MMNFLLQMADSSMGQYDQYNTINRINVINIIKVVSGLYMTDRFHGIEIPKAEG